MSKYHAVTLKVTFGVLADSEAEAERIAAEMLPDEAEYPARASVSIDAYHTPNQSDNLKRQAVNYE